MDAQLLAQLKSWNPWWQFGAKGIDRYRDPIYKRELYSDIWHQFQQGSLIVSLVGMRQVGKSTIMRQMIRELLQSGVRGEDILFVSFDDPYLRASYDQKKIFEDIVGVYTEHVLGEDISVTKRQLYFFFDEIHQLPQWEKTLKSYFDRAFPVRYVVSGSSSLRLQNKNRESLLGRISEWTLWPFSFREYVEKKSQDEGDKSLLEIVGITRESHATFLSTNSISEIIDSLQKTFIRAHAFHKQVIVNHLKQFILEGGFPRVWQQPDFASKQRTLWEQHIAKVLYEDLPQVAKIRKVKDLETLYVRMVDYNGKEAVLGDIQEALGVHWETLNRYLEYLGKTFLIFRVNRTKSKHADFKRRSGNVKFYVTDVALRNALRKKTEEVYDDPEEMGLIAENLVCTAIQRWLSGPQREEQVSYFRDNTGEIDFIVKNIDRVIPIEVKWKNDISSLKTLDRVCKKWGLEDSILITKDFDLTYKNGRLSLPLWFFLLAF